MKTDKKLEEKIWKQNKIEQEDVVLAAVSGGADSVCLLLLLKELQKKIGFLLEVIHVEHGIRGEESRQDAEFVKELCRQQGVRMHMYEVDVPSFSEKEGIGLEEAARILRYEAFGQEAHKWTAGGRKVKIALAHHADDNAETVLFQMIRGSNLDGMAGMREERELEKNIWLLRPMLGIRRSEIEVYLKEKKQGYCVDSTNTDTEYSRNKIRREVIPILTEVNKQAVPHISQTAKMLGEVADYLHEQAERAYTESCRKQEDGIQIAEVLWEKYPAFLQKEVLYLALADVVGGEKDLTRLHVEALWELGRRQVGRKLDLPKGVKAVRTYQGIFLNKRKNDEQEKKKNQMFPEMTQQSGEKEETLILAPEDLKRAELPEGLFVSVKNGTFHLRVFPFQGNTEEISQKTYTKWLNYDKINNGLQIRNRRQGDYLTIDKAGHTKKLKEYFVQEKVPQEERKNIWLLADEAHILWVVGRRISSDYKVSSDTKKVLEVQFLEEM
ncbi:MAG: tRNA lysidine(34) synthetase TilS [Roseburia sp.]